MEWSSPQKPAELTEQRLIEAILDGLFPIGSALPAERDLATQIGVTRPTLREALQRLERDGWIDIRHGRSTRVRDYWQEGNLGVLSALANHPKNLPSDFVYNLLFVRQLMAPAYTRLAIEQAALQAAESLSLSDELPESATAFAAFDWNLHHRLTILSGNPIFTLILNGFRSLYLPMGERYFSHAPARQHSRLFYTNLLAAAQAKDAFKAETITSHVMEQSLALWQAANLAANTA